MCGISGIYNLTGRPVAEGEIAAQIDAIVHRGPNQGAVYCSPQGCCGLGIRRLSIIDVAGGHQPLHNEDDTIQLVYNGETYNYRSLWADLAALGHRARTHSDGEVIVHGYEAWGAEGLLQRLRGMTAFALWDETQQQLLLGRDRFGIKPLYYTEHAGRLYFASEIKAILSEPSLPRRVNLAALQAMLTLGFVPGPATMFEGIYKLPPAHFLLARHGAFQIKPYWQLDYQENTAISENEATEQFLALLEEAVKIRLMSEVPLGALLSGGLDSGTLVALISKQMPVVSSQSLVEPLMLPDLKKSAVGGRRSAVALKTISIGFDQPGYDEAGLAGDLATCLGADHHPIHCTPADFESYPAIMRHLEEPQCSATAIPIYKLYRACHEAGLTVVLTGEGADELLGGYHWHRGDALVRPLLALPGGLRRFLAASPLPISTAARRVLARGAHQIDRRYRDWLEVNGADYRQNLLLNEVRAALPPNGAMGDEWSDKLLNGRSIAPLHQMLWLESRTRMVDFINFEVDKLSMAHSIEARVPFLDHKLWEFCATLPARYKLKNGMEKYLLRRATRPLLPESTRTRRKKGLAAPYASWLRAERLPDWAEVALSPASLRRAGLFEPATVQRLRQAHQAGRPDLGPLLMGVLSTQVWVDCFLLD